MQTHLIEHLREAATGFDAAVPLWNDKIEPLCAVYSTRCLEHIANALQKNRKVISFFDKVNIKYIRSETVKKIDPQGLSFFNINSSQDYQKALNIYQKMLIGRNNLVDS